jgi:hypothetical protein
MIKSLSAKQTILIFAVVISVSIFYFHSMRQQASTTISGDRRLKFALFTQFSKSSKKEYYDQCYALFKKLRHPKPEMLFDIPPKMPPSYLKEAFEDFGNMKISGSFYFNDKYKDSVDNSVNKQVPIVTSKTIEDIQRQAVNKESYGTYGVDTKVHEFLVKYNRFVQNKSGLVIGTETPWVEALIMLTGASNVTTLDYTYKKYESKNMKWFHVNDYLDESIKKRNYEQFDFSVSFSSIEHSGLGRYGDPLSPYGDLEALQQIHCMLKPGGVLVLGLPCSHDLQDSFIEYNAHRLYGKKRFKLLFGNDWVLIEHQPSQVINHNVFFLVKI